MDEPVRTEVASSARTCKHMRQMAQELGLKRDPETGEYQVMMCITPTVLARGDTCGRIIPVGREQCCYCQGTKFGPAPDGTVELGTCHYRCKRCKRVTRRCGATECAYCLGTVLKLLPPVIIIDGYGLQDAEATTA